MVPYTYRMKPRGFTMIEMIIAIVIVSAIITVSIASISNVRAKSRDGRRTADVAVIMNAVYQYALDNNNQPPATITATSTEICKTGASSCTGLIDLSVLTTGQKYIATLPIDPAVASTSSGTGYFVLKNSYGRVTVSAPRAELASTSLTR